MVIWLDIGWLNIAFHLIVDGFESAWPAEFVMSEENFGCSKTLEEEVLIQCHRQVMALDWFYKLGSKQLDYLL